MKALAIVVLSVGIVIGLMGLLAGAVTGKGQPGGRYMVVASIFIGLGLLIQWFL